MTLAFLNTVYNSDQGAMEKRCLGRPSVRLPRLSGTDEGGKCPTNRTSSFFLRH